MLLRAVREFTPGEHHPVVAGIAFQPDICPQAHNGPFEPATGVCLAQFYAVSEVQFLQHEGIISHDIIF